MMQGASPHLERPFVRWPSALRHAPFRTYAVGSTISLAGAWTQRTALGWYMWDLTHSGFWLGVMVLAELMPSVVFTAIGGIVADRHGSPRVILATQALLVIYGTLSYLLIAQSMVGPTFAVALATVGGAIAALRLPASLAVVSDLLPAADRAQGAAIVSILLNLARMVGPGLAGVIIARWGVGEAFLASACCALVSFLVIRTIGRVTAPAAISAPSARPWTALIDSIRYIYTTPQLRLIFAVYIAAAIGVRPFADMLPGLAGTLYGGDAETLAILGAAFGLGSLIGGLAIAARGQAFSTRSISWACTGAALAVIAFVFVGDFWLAALAVAMAGLFTVLFGVGAQTVIHTMAEARMRGRILSFFSLISLSGSASGAELSPPKQSPECHPTCARWTTNRPTFRPGILPA